MWLHPPTMPGGEEFVSLMARGQNIVTMKGAPTKPLGEEFVLCTADATVRGAQHSP
jgi:hypothetical protein